MKIEPPAESEQFVVCVDNEGYGFDLLLEKRYRVIPDPDGEEVGLVRVVDETGEDYLYPRSMFAAVEPSQAAQGEMLRAS
ncbi:MAG TPA: hypothetical protein VEY93_07395 [Longimicrobium sp.]|nr:hypothetical protein [Longimicrobium sp.]